ncbi:MAG: hypothetical protein ING19_18920 [Azospirillum sp.]|nr:hypothetical protein [Azospirillum sp.]
MSAEDVYSFGLTLYTVLSRRKPDGGNPCLARESARRRLVHGTYASSILPSAIPSEFAAPIEAMLDDRVVDRLTPERLLSWTYDLRFPARQKRRNDRPTAPISIGSGSAYSIKELAFLAYSDGDDLMRSVQTGALSDWLADNAGEATAAAICKMTPGIAQAFFQTRFVTALEPRLPLRYGNLEFRPTAFGDVLRHAATNAEAKETLLAFAGSGLSLLWCQAARRHSVYEIVPSTFERSESMLKDPGLSECLYKDNPDAPCLSPRLWNRFVFDAESALRLLESHISQAGGLDREERAFFAARFGLSQDFFSILDVENKNVPNLFAKCRTALLAIHDVAAKIGLSTPGILGAFAPAIRRVIDAYRHPATREALKADVENLIAAGDCGAVVDRIFSPEARGKDEFDFANAYNEASLAKSRIEEREPSMVSRRLAAIATAEALLSVMLAGICVVAFALGVWVEFRSGGLR